MITKSNSAMKRRPLSQQRRSRRVVRYLRTYDERALSRALDARAHHLEVLIYALRAEQAKLMDKLMYAVAHITTASALPPINES